MSVNKPQQKAGYENLSSQKGFQLFKCYFGLRVCGKDKICIVINPDDLDMQAAIHFLYYISKKFRIKYSDVISAEVGYRMNTKVLFFDAHPRSNRNTPTADSDYKPNYISILYVRD